ncbi:carotenoid oxygenase family protein [Actinomadura parmotrematis]|uniref:Dioxygenase n=1 Tax=Actinomadura parmotrematis TaxID=2864039 RepID=A0ABS7FYB4_9ACTN|nr:carotenoid oxygenase family protein [Actinomadura parmotrematis]MBW8485417.1 carotenoid oxygenase family protein [Actinomadura parmotrematis]
MGHLVYESLDTEHDYAVTEIDGALPDGLTGTLYRNGPGRWQVGETLLDHIFDGDGMLSMFSFAGGRVRYRNRYVRTRHYRLGQRHGRAVLRGLGTQRPGGALANALRPPANVANTGVVLHAGHLLALWEGGRPFRLDPDSLETLGEHSFGGRLRPVSAFSAHPSRCPDTGELFNFGMDLTRPGGLRCYRVDTRGNLHHLPRLRLPYTPWNHDFALTRRHLVFVVNPVVPKAGKILLGTGSVAEALSYEPHRPTCFALVPRYGGRARVVEHAALLGFHLVNAFEDGTDTVVEFVRFADWDRVTTAFRDFRTDDFPWGCGLMRYRIGPTGKVTGEEVAGGPMELPHADVRYAGRPHRHTWFAGRTPDGTGVHHLDHRTGERKVHTLPPGHGFGEPVFVPRAPDAPEGDGWLLTLAHDPHEHRSRLLVLDARDVEAEPLAAVRLRHHIPMGFHGTFTSRVAVPPGL